jgi:hypothetical protein
LRERAGARDDELVTQLTLQRQLGHRDDRVEALLLLEAADRRDQHGLLAEPGPVPVLGQGLGRRPGERARGQPRVAQRDRGGQRVRQPRPPDRLGPGQELARGVVRDRAEHVRPQDVTEQHRGGAVAEVLAHRIEDVAALNAVDDYWPPAEQPECVGRPIRERRVRIDIIRIDDIDMIIDRDSIKLSGDRVEQMTVGHSTISADFFDVMDLDPRAGVVLRISGRPTVCDLVLFRASERRERCIVPQCLLCVPGSIGRVLAQRGKSELRIHRRHPDAQVMAWNGWTCGSKKPHDGARATPCQ